MNKRVTVIGAGLAGCEAARQLSVRGVKVRLFDCKPFVKSPAHESDDFCELVCSNSLKSDEPASAGGLLKAEMRRLGSLILVCAADTRVPAGGALAVDRGLFSKTVTDKVRSDKNIEIVSRLVTEIDTGEVTVIATGPLTVGALNDSINSLFDGRLFFYDAAAPIVARDGIDMNRAFFAGRYGKGGGDYLNCPMSRDEYELFWRELAGAECALMREFEKSDIFEGCMPIEILAKRGIDTLRFGPLKPVGLTDPVSGARPYAAVQLRKENAAGSMFNLVGFQTNLKFGEQKRVFSLIPALKNAEFLRYGVMHRNSYIDAPKSLIAFFQSKKHPNVFIAGQLSGVEGYMESAASGIIAGINAARFICGEPLFLPPETTLLGSLCRYVAAANENFQPMNANFGILPPLTQKFKSKEERKLEYYNRSISDFQAMPDGVNDT
jgi:methylenetetrahydrofolate--tRNA-(uracil-5-)-methyltransferase